MEIHAEIERVALESRGRLVASLTAQCRDLAAAEDAVAEAFRQALESWPRNGMPETPAAWLLVVARRRLRDTSRHARRFEELKPVHASVTPIPDFIPDDAIKDERLQMLFLCAHPAIDGKIHTALMLQAVLGLSAEQIASAFLVRPSTLGQRLSRAKAKIREANIRFELPPSSEMPDRLTAVLEAIYAAYGTGWNDHMAGSDTQSRGLTQEAIFLGRLLAALLPDQAEAHGLLALMLYCESRTAARWSAMGSYIPLHEQRSELWSKQQMAEAGRHLFHASAMGAIGRFQLEAAIQSAHTQRMITGSTDWVAIETLYRTLINLAPTAGAIIAHAAAASEAYGVEYGLKLMQSLPAGDFAQYQPYWALFADLQRRAGHRDAARLHYERAIGLCQDPAIRRFLLERAESM